MGRADGERASGAADRGGVLAGGIGVLAYGTHLSRRSELQTIDARFSIRGKQSPPSDIVLVAIDPVTFQELRTISMPVAVPLPAPLLRQGHRPPTPGGAKVIAMDIEFTHPTDEREDNALFEAVGRAHGKTILGTDEVANGRTAPK